MADAHIHTERDQASAEAAAGRIRSEGIPVRVEEQFPYVGAPLRAFRLYVPDRLARRARRSLGIVEPEEPLGRRGYYVLIVPVALALLAFGLGLLQRLG